MRFADYFNSENALNLSGILVTIMVGALSVYTVQNTAIWPLIALLSIAVLFCFIGFLSVSSRKRKLSLFWIEAIVILALYFLVNTDTIAILGIIWIVQAAEIYGSKRAAWLLVVSISIFALSQIYHSSTNQIFGALVSAALFGMFQIFALSVVQRGIQERKLREETAALNRELIATRELLSQTAAQSERVRIARDLHDILGHHMTALILNLEVANHSVQNQHQKAQEKVEQALALAKLLLGDIRSAVSELREDSSVDLQQSIQKLVLGIPNLNIDIDFSAAAPITKVEHAETLLRCTQESITNILRHSSATKCRIVVEHKGDKCVLTVSDNGSDKGEVEVGNGLKGMAERVKSSGGELSWEQTETGFVLRVELPTESSH